VFSKLLGLQYKVIYKKESENRVVDALSRRLHPNEELCSLSTVIPHWIQQVQDSYSSDKFAHELLTKLSLGSAVVPHYTLKDGLLRYKHRL
jgi:hypothetical protein